MVDYADSGFGGGSSQPSGLLSQNTSHASVTPAHHDHRTNEPQVDKPVSISKAVVDVDVVLRTTVPADQASDAVSVASSSRASNPRPPQLQHSGGADSVGVLGGAVRLVQVLSTLFHQTVLRMLPVRAT